ncbi:MAG: hypothetical protein EPO28_15275 [Saprospiraceae bacterium]|nr:MAG: hypothetical protein EPO28_15275 [Saprospiraceae bacterium]
MQEAFPKVPQVEFTTDVFGFYASVSAVYSSKIKGGEIEFDSYLKHKFHQVSYRPDYTKKTNDLFAAYAFALNTPLQPHVLKAHAILSEHMLAASGRGRIRTKIEMILDKEGRIEYVAAPPAIVEGGMKKLLSDVNLLLKGTIIILLNARFCPFDICY